jgi:hypothetical protein
MHIIGLATGLFAAGCYIGIDVWDKKRRSRGITPGKIFLPVSAPATALRLTLVTVALVVMAAFAREAAIWCAGAILVTCTIYSVWDLRRQLSKKK